MEKDMSILNKSTVPGSIANNEVIFRDFLSILDDSFLKILRVNLTTKVHQDILMNFREQDMNAGYSENIDEWLKGFAKNGGVHPEDLRDYKKYSDLEFLKRHFDNADEDFVISYRRVYKDDYHWVNMVLKKTQEYTPENRWVMLYIRDIDKEINKDADINKALFEAFNVYVGSLTYIDALKGLLNVGTSFYGARGGIIYKKNKKAHPKVIAFYGTSEIEAGKESDMIGQFGKDSEYEIRIINPTENTDTKIIQRSIMMLAQIFIDEQNEREYELTLENKLRIIGGLSNIYFSVYLVNTKENRAERIHSAEYLDRLFGDIDDPRAILQLMEEYLVEDPFKESIHQFNDIDKWGERLINKNDISQEFKGPNVGWARVNVIVLDRDRDGVPFEYIYTVRDINDQKEREDAINESLVDALEYANNASKAKSMFLSNMSHDIRTPMNAIIGYTKLAKEHMGEKDKIEEYVENIEIAGNHLMRLINDCLDMSRIESGRVVITNAPIAIVDILENIKLMNASETERKGIEFILDTDGIVHKNVLGDRLRLNQVIINLVGNAIKFTEPGGTVSLKAYERAKRNSTSVYVFKIKDTGIGIDESFMERLFDPFEREQTVTESGIVGTGLGLAIVKNLVELMEGTIKVESTKGVGTEFTVEIPLKFAEEESGISSDENENIPDVDITKLKILLVEDNLVNRKIAKALFSDKNINYDEAFNGKEAIDVLLSKEPDFYDLILMDVQMPVMDGHEATKAIRAMEDERLRNIPIIAMTANAFDEDRRASLKAGMNAHIAKPIDIDLLMETIQKVISQRG